MCSIVHVRRKEYHSLLFDLVRIYHENKGTSSEYRENRNFFVIFRNKYNVQLCKNVLNKLAAPLIPLNIFGMEYFRRYNGEIDAVDYILHLPRGFAVLSSF